MEMNKIGLVVSICGLLILSSAILYPLGYMGSEKAVRYLSIIGPALIVVGLLIRKNKKS